MFVEIFSQLQALKSVLVAFVTDPATWIGAGAVALYAIVLMLVCWGAKKTWGDGAPNKVLYYTPLGWPALFVIFLVLGIYSIFSWPKRFYDRRQMEMVFAITSFHREDWSHNQDRVEAVLSEKARDLHNQYREQARVRKSSPTDVPAKKKQDRLVAQKKKEFWSARALAMRSGYSVEDHTRDYLEGVLDPTDNRGEFVRLATFKN